MSHPLPLSHFHDQLLAAQWILNPTLTKPITCIRALLILSRPVSSVLIGEDEMYAFEFFGLYWTHGAHGDCGWFDSEDAAVEYLKSLLTG